MFSNDGKVCLGESEKTLCDLVRSSSPRISLCSSSSPAHRVGNGGKVIEAVSAGKTLAALPTVISLGSQKSSSDWETAGRWGDGEGDSEGQALMHRRSNGCVVGVGGIGTCANSETGVNERHLSLLQSSTVNVIDFNSASQACLKSSKGSSPKRVESFPVAEKQLEGGLLMVLPDTDSAGVDGTLYASQAPSTLKVCWCVASSLRKMVGLVVIGLGDAIGVDNPVLFGLTRPSAAQFACRVMG